MHCTVRVSSLKPHLPSHYNTHKNTYDIVVSTFHMELTPDHSEVTQSTPSQGLSKQLLEVSGFWACEHSLWSKTVIFPSTFL